MTNGARKQRGGARPGAGRKASGTNVDTARRLRLARIVHDVILSRLVSVREQHRTAFEAFDNALRQAIDDLESFAVSRNAQRELEAHGLIDLARLRAPMLDRADIDRLVSTLFGDEGRDGGGAGARRVAGELTSRALGRRDDWYRKTAKRGKALSPVGAPRRRPAAV